MNNEFGIRRRAKKGIRVNEVAMTLPLTNVFMKTNRDIQIIII